MTTTKVAKLKNAKLVPPNLMAPIVLAGEEPEDMLLPTLHIFHDVGNESRERGEHPKGSAFDSLTNEEIATAPEPFRDYALPWWVPLNAYSEYVAWGEKRGDPPRYVTRDRPWIES